MRRSEQNPSHSTVSTLHFRNSAPPPAFVELGSSEAHPSTLVETIKQVVVGDRLYQGDGDSSIFEKSVLRCCFRNINVAAEYTMVASPIREVVLV